MIYGLQNWKILMSWIMGFLKQSWFWLASNSFIVVDILWMYLFSSIISPRSLGI